LATILSSISIGAINQTVSVDVAAIVGALEARYKDQLADARAREAAYQDQIRALTETVTALAQQRTQPDASSSIDDALAELSQGRTAAAEAIFQRVVAGKASDIQEAAEALYHLGTLAFLHDTSKALHAYRRAVELAPAHIGGWNQLGHLLVRIGQLDNAIDAYSKVLTLGEETGDRGYVASALGNLGNVYRIRGDLAQAENMYRAALQMNEALEHTEGIASACNSLGSVYTSRGFG
jgi:tetratricopeptide (TPR) repeat protein